MLGPVEADPEYKLIVDSNNMTVEIDNEISKKAGKHGCGLRVMNWSWKIKTSHLIVIESEVYFMFFAFSSLLANSCSCSLSGIYCYPRRRRGY